MASGSDHNLDAPQWPAIGVGAVIFRGRQVLLIKRGKPPRQGQWSLPGGRQELGETVIEAVQREVLEETGLRVEDIRFLEIVDFIDRDRVDRVRFHYTLLDFMMEAPTGQLVPGSDAADAAWFDLAELAGLGLWDETLRIIAKAADLRGLSPRHS